MPTHGMILLIGGRSTRAHLPVKKQYFTIDDVPLFIHTFRAVSKFPFAAIIVVAPEGEIDAVREMLAINGHDAPVVAGGAARCDSVLNGMEALAAYKPDYVFIHDGVRPLIATADLENLADTVITHDAAILASPVTDTIKVVTDNKIIDSPDRTCIYRALTPQAFSYQKYRRALMRYFADDARSFATDDAAIYSRYEGTVHIVEGNPYNIKITREEDIDIYATLLHMHKETSL
ncbi:MAG: 2-C-methyl-D-erythritol 4-phosphate cytidylyltransferase [Spirochaetes bacterium]|nr:2-C-methyl-D-erythritol 4-phosphate cytidylyltransferase [Spirochaetota bacterium]